jgi:hypothetical protein
MIENIREYYQHLYTSLFESRNTPGRLSARRVGVILFIFLVYPFWVVYLVFGYLLDEIFYRGYRRQEVKEPIFIVGNFRSGTTFLHRLLLEDQQNTGIRTWEIYFAPSVSYRKLINAIRRVSRLIGSPIRWLVNRFDESLNEYSYMHKTGMRQFEEDSHLFYHVWSSYNLFAIFPFPKFARKYIYYDERVSPARRRFESRYYRNLIKRHLHYHGGGRYISKNPDFSPMVKTLLERFPDAKFINIVRDPQRVVPSTINMWANHWHTFGTPAEAYPLQEILLDHIKHWYRYPHEVLSGLPQDRYAVLYFDRFTANPRAEIERLYDQFGMEVSPEFREVLEEQTRRSRNYRSSHDYSLEEIGLDPELISREFSPVLEIYRPDDPSVSREPELIRG